MKRLLRRTVLALAAVALLVGPALAQGTTITILSVDDTHANLHAGGPKDANLDGTLGGIAKAAMVVAQERAANPGSVLFLHAGDSFFGDAYFGATLGAAELQLLKAAGLDAMALGNHELWIGTDPLLLGYTTAFPGGAGGFPLLCANLLQPVPFVSAHTTLQAGGVTVGLFGLLTPYDALTNESTGGIVTGAVPQQLLDIAAGEVIQLRRRARRSSSCCRTSASSSTGPSPRTCPGSMRSWAATIIMCSRRPGTESRSSMPARTTATSAR